ncbi:MAG: flagellar basal-body rod protein FlgF [Gammaproteobacteria bacterium]|nr:MAG: flagellar basal-body rod protein FlgF [Gammaproteobacteria bacterium]
MDRFLYLSMSGAREIMRAQAVNANNLANVSTTGYKADFAAMLQSRVIGPGIGNTRIYAQTIGTGTDLSRGQMIHTGRDLDVAVHGDGWIAVQAPDGSEAYTRSGSLRIDDTGLLQTETGLLVLGNDGPITLPPHEQVEIGDDGTITVRGLGQSPQALNVLDRIRLVNPDPARLHKGEDGLLRVTDNKPVAADPNVQLVRETLEGSNANAVDGLVKMISLSRQFELQVKMMKTAEENDQAATSLMRIG